MVSSRRMVPALLLCGLIGFLGAHRFYAGKIITGTLQGLATLIVLGWVLVDFPYQNGEIVLDLAIFQLLAFALVNLPPCVDFCRLLSGKFTDGAGHPIAE